MRTLPPRVSNRPWLTFDDVTDFDLRVIHRFLEDEWTSVLNEGVIVGRNYLHVLMEADRLGRFFAFISGGHGDEIESIDE